MERVSREVLESHGRSKQGERMKALIPDKEIIRMWLDEYEDQINLRNELEKRGFQIEIFAPTHTPTHTEQELIGVNKLLNSSLDDDCK